MPSALDDILIGNNEFLFTKAKRLTDKIDEHINNNLFNFFKFGETNDVSWLIKEQNKYKEQKENNDPNTTTSQKENCQTTIKQEKLSISSTKSRSSKQLTKSSRQSTRSRKQSVILEESNYMQAPSKLPPRKKKIQTETLESPQRPIRSTRTKPKIQQCEQINGKFSEVMIQNSTITVIDITEDKNSEKETSDNEQTHKLPVRSTRTKTRQDKKKQEEAEAEKAKLNQKQSTATKKIKRELCSNSEDEQENAKRSKSSSNESEKNNKTAQTEYEDAISDVDITETNTDAVNATMVVEKPKIVNNKESKTSQYYKTPPKTKSKKQQFQEIFSPYEKSSLKKKVEAFEKFGSSSKQPSSTSKIPLLYKEDHGTGSAVKLKHFTPLNKFQPKNSSTIKITNKLFSDSKKSFQHNDSALSMKSLSTLKASQAEYREREKLRHEKEKEAQLKKEAILQAQAEDKKRKREEKQLKAQQQRDLLVLKEKDKLLELQKQKEERHKQAKAEKDEKLQKSKAEVEKKRLMAKNKAKLVKDSVKRRETAETAELPIYMTTKALLLPLVDCYDSDDERYAEHHKNTPSWCSGSALNKQLYSQLIAGEKIKNTLFCSMNDNPDLVQIFERVDSKKLKRTSSAQWKKPPRYTLFSETNNISFSDDSD